AALVGDGKQAPAGGLHDQCRPAAEIVCRRRQNKTAAELERTKARRLGLVALEMLNGARIDLDGLDACGGPIVLGGSRPEGLGPVSRLGARQRRRGDGWELGGWRRSCCDRAPWLTPHAAARERRPTPNLLQFAAGGGRRQTPRFGATLLKQFHELVGHGAGELGGISDGDGTAVVARDIVANADRDELDGGTRLDLLDDLA